MSSPQERTAFITGTAQGVGLAIAREFFSRGMRVVMADRDHDRNRDRAAEIDSSGKRAVPVELDVSDPAAAEEAIETEVERSGSVEVLVNNAAVTGGTSVWDLGIEEWDEVMATNLRSVFVLSRAAGRHMREHGFGRIVNLGSLAGQAARPSGTAYATSKAGILALTRLFAMELAPYGVTVNAVAPGVIDTPMVQAVDEDTLERLIAAIPVRRMAEPREIASLVAFLASDEAGFVNGATYDINGGTLMR